MPSKKKGRSSRSDSDVEYKFKKDEKVLILPSSRDENIYEAKIVECKVTKHKDPQYKIHYHGWNKRWDEWVDQRRVLKINPSNIQIMNETNSANKQSTTEQKSNTSQSTTSSSSSSSKKRKQRPQSKSPSASSKKRRKLSTHHKNHKHVNEEDDQDDDDDDDDEHEENEQTQSKHNGTRGRKRRKRRGAASDDDADSNNDDEDDNDDDDDQDDDDANKHNNSKNSNSRNGNAANGDQDTSQQPLEIKLPRELKCRLITDWENITKKNMLIALPRSSETRISQILADFQEYAIRTGGHDRNIVLEISRGIKDYFNQALHVTLLYKLERKQHQAITSKHKQLSMDQIYGAEHLCRLFVKLPQLLSPNDLDADTRHILQQQIECIIQFIMKNEAKYFCTQYIQQ